ncbi:MAG: hypothetical protein GTO63_00680 [Anaerolineae bacterium]|nr:hypothetical protein [Anaerolineae bacterium]NIN93521.1 hypothetical protein [Anaerolineae bacterium]NIQ76595.1 hypothetical protein [Anaerolineae bacterium]
MSRIGHGIAIRCAGKAVNVVYGAGQKVLDGFAKWASIPVINTSPTSTTRAREWPTF